MKVSYKVDLVFDHWKKGGKDFRESDPELYHRLTIGDFHGGTVFPGTISLDAEQAEQISEGLKAGCEPIFWLSPERNSQYEKGGAA